MIQHSLASGLRLIGDTKSFVLRPAHTSDIDWLAAQEARAYSAADAIPSQRLHDWFAVNPHIFGILCDHDGSPVGHLNLLPVKPAPLQSLLKGTLRERDVSGDDLYAATERDQVSALWVESVMVEIASPLQRARALLHVLEQMPAMIARLADPAKVEQIYALAATDGGEQLVRRFGFQVVSSREQRADAHDLFGITFNALQERAHLIAARQSAQK